jgi:hypothetical protein
MWNRSNAAEAAVVALFSLFEHVQVGVEVFLLGPGRAVDALQLFVAMVAAPVGAGHFHQLESFELAVLGTCGPRQRSMKSPSR